MSENTSTSERNPFIDYKQPSAGEFLKDKCLRKGIHIREFDFVARLIQEYSETAVKVAQAQANAQEKARREKSELMRIVSDNRRWKEVEQELPPYNKAVLLSSGGIAYVGKRVKSDEDGEHYIYAYCRKCSDGISVIDIVDGFKYWADILKPPE